MQPSDRPTLICLTPVRNEAWILERFLRCASLWADHIVVADQASEDASREICRGFSKVTLVDNNSPAYHEGARQQLLLDAARSLPCPGKRVLVALDADEMLSANFPDSPEWARALAGAAPGTVLKFDWVNVLPGFEKCWIPSEPVPFGFVDDGSAHSGSAIHSRRVPVPAGAPEVRLADVRVLHYQYVAWQRMTSKQRWYQCWERINHPTKRAVAIFRQYQRMHGWPAEEMHGFRPEWIEGYERAGIDMRTVESERETWWDREVVRWMAARGPGYFRKLAVWDGVEWPAVARAAGIDAPPEQFRDPRSGIERAVHKWLEATQSRAAEWKVRWVQRALRLAGW